MRPSLALVVALVSFAAIATDKDPPPRAEADAAAEASAAAEAAAAADAAATASAESANSIVVESLAQVSASFGMGHSGDSGEPTAGCYFPNKPGRSLPMFGRSAKYARDDDCVCREIAALYVAAGRSDLAVRQLETCGGIAEAATTHPIDSCSERVERAAEACGEVSAK